MSVKVQGYTNEVEEKVNVASFITDLIKDKGIKPSDIAVIAKKHCTLESIASILNSGQVDINYERKENILNNPDIIWIQAYLKLILNCIIKCFFFNSSGREE